MKIRELFENVDEYDRDDTRPTLDDVNRIAKAINNFARDNGVTAELRQFREVYFPAIELTDLFAERLGSGSGTKVMLELTRMADEADINIYLRPSEPRNKIFYSRFGFEPDPQHRSMMVRYPPYELDEAENDYKLHRSDDDVKPDGEEFWKYRSKDIEEDFSAVSSKDADDKKDDQERKRNLDNFLRGNHPSVPKILYHGSRSESDFEVFKPSFGTYGTGIYLTDKPNVASDFAMGIRGGATDEKMGGRVIPLYVSMKQPFIDEYLRHTEWKKYIEDVIDKNFKRSHLWRREEYEPIKDNIFQKLDNGTATIRDLFIDKNNNVLQDLGCNEIAETIHRSGFDGIIINRPDGSIEYIVFKPEQVKSAIGNIGTFDPNEPNINEDNESNNPKYVTRIDSKPIQDFSSNMKTYKHLPDWSQSGMDSGDDSYWKEKNLKPQTSKGVFAADPLFSALYATGNANETKYVAIGHNGLGKSIVWFDKNDEERINSKNAYLTVFDASSFKKLPSGEYFSDNPVVVQQKEITDPFKYIISQGWEIRFTDDLHKVLKQLQKQGKKPSAEGL